MEKTSKALTTNVLTTNVLTTNVLTTKVNRSAITPLMNGYMVMAAVLLVWSGFALSVRAIGSSPLAIADVALIRFSVPMILLTPFVFANIHELKRVRVSDALLLLVGGVPFLFLASLGAKSAPTAYVGTILAGTPPLFVAMIGHFFLSQKVSKKRAFTLSLILLGVVTMVIGNSSDGSAEMLTGVGLLLSASVLWAIYTVGIKRAGISAFSVAIILSYSSFFITLALILTDTVATHWGSFSVQEAMPFVLVQGVGVGVLATIGYSYAVGLLGSARASIMGSISPCLTAMLAIPVFDEPLSIAIVCGVSLTITGVIWSNKT
ncbi:DMT family transporter [Vibrio tapetis]|uniref:Putative Permease of the drug/metabolite transporter (DMT) superfamily n=1 Tax=Vibrio tapetis subsp. tapetis TaxID=1671868 RepID=A0A2N8ZLS1_9VIBR|nr:DMT family transporter [Vibrio tapetis]SON52849.1 putative Permease of the drug/metabolite transporter (DMT) superfamily [Vibrio tapetis subsp. tapetis]